MKHPASLEQIVTHGLCLGCGLCQSVAGRDYVEMGWVDPPGRLRPRIKQPLRAEQQQAILRICPGARLDEPVDHRHSDDVKVDASFGPWMNVWKGHASEPEIHHLASSGGALSALGVYLLETNKVEFVLHVKASSERPMRSRVQVSTSRAEVLEAAGSRYGPVDPLSSFTEQLDKGVPFAVIGKPCDVSGVHNMRAHDPRVDELVRYTLAFSCGTFSDLQCSRWMLDRQGVPGGEQNLSLFRYRGYGCPGPTRAVTLDGQIFDEPYLEFWYGPHGWTHQFRCRICADPTGEMTDISVADAWPGGGPTEEEWGGYSLFVSRTKAGDALMHEAIAADAVTVTSTGIEAMYECQPHQAVKKQGIAARLRALDSEDQLGPRFNNVRIEDAAAQRDENFHIDNFAGARDRIHRGLNHEPAPTAESDSD